MSDRADNFRNEISKLTRISHHKAMVINKSIADYYQAKVAEYLHLARMGVGQIQN